MKIHCVADGARVSNFLSPCFDDRRANGIMLDQGQEPRANDIKADVVLFSTLTPTTIQCSVSFRRNNPSKLICPPNSECELLLLSLSRLMMKSNFYLVDRSEIRISSLPVSTIDEPMELCLTKVKNHAQTISKQT